MSRGTAFPTCLRMRQVKTQISLRYQVSHVTRSVYILLHDTTFKKLGAQSKTLQA